MQKQGSLRATVKWSCIAVALLIAGLWVGSRWAALDWQTGTRLIVSIDQGMMILVVGDEPLSSSIELDQHEPDQVAWQWWFAEYPHSYLLPLWVPALAFAGIGLCLGLARSSSHADLVGAQPLAKGSQSASLSSGAPGRRACSRPARSRITIETGRQITPSTDSGMV